ncbi:hypothetical protein Kuja_0260 [Vibrio phage vB_VchM_Kuja]|uniref:Uncharacterized protein n=1 Tax=Vibrio phage vB_VchM_Kuja TaxID=2686437 RepID=A0A6B9JHN8_9CAUD|nr:hypothetical protein HWC83_gp026 [Vibrio phage vB_VchM_Kuja]QGZ16017.1 hypothetical protein Kuja_0260 [Vibrio phage vB_VchM_Kuja]
MFITPNICIEKNKKGKLVLVESDIPQDPTFMIKLISFISLVGVITSFV